MVLLSTLIKERKILAYGYIPRHTGASEHGNTSVIKNLDGSVTIYTPDKDSHGKPVTANAINRIIWEEITVPAN
jgi:hypothetical protein